MIQSPSSLTRMQLLASSNSKSCRSSMRFAYSESCFKLRFRLRASHSGNGRAVEEPEMVYTGTAPWFVSFISRVRGYDLVWRVVLFKDVLVEYEERI